MCRLPAAAPRAAPVYKACTSDSVPPLVKADFRRARGVQYAGHRAAGVLHQLAGLLAGAVQRGRIAPGILQRGAHGIQRSGAGARGGSIIQIYHGKTPPGNMVVQDFGVFAASANGNLSE